MLTYNKSSVLLSLVWQVTYCVNVGRVEDKEAWLKSQEMRKKACGCSVCSELVTEWMTSQAASALAEGGVQTITCVNSLGSPMASLKVQCPYCRPVLTCTVMCPELHQLSLTNTASPPPFLLPLSAVLSACRSWNPSRLASVSGVSSVNHVSVSTMMLHSDAGSASILLGRDLTFPMMTDKRAGL